MNCMLSGVSLKLVNDLNLKFFFKKYEYLEAIYRIYKEKLTPKEKLRSEIEGKFNQKFNVSTSESKIWLKQFREKERMLAAEGSDEDED